MTRLIYLKREEIILVQCSGSMKNCCVPIAILLLFISTGKGLRPTPGKPDQSFFWSNVFSLDMCTDDVQNSSGRMAKDDQDHVISKLFHVQKEAGEDPMLGPYATGSSLPDCSHACGPCFPCKRVMSNVVSGRVADSVADGGKTDSGTADSRGCLELLARAAMRESHVRWRATGKQLATGDLDDLGRWIGSTATRIQFIIFLKK
ncbi:hypothetical protein IEQ34_017260 [Dendrobium chrysotoxum]|uniref:Epidermal patterning factor-like protein n=1 Tax=Dendrobium chrysotoxum TaxID=161865 RepID=A0AAV7G940_DENCH|nr:hypothetical protein IEQ34_017260 [Dendrobium chrysotoxum]